MQIKNIFVLVASIIICELAGVIGSLFTISEIPTWYAGLVKPALNPPSWVFGPVWTTLYLLMGVAAYLVWRKGWESVKVRRALYVFGGQLFFNAIWSPIFFGLHSPALAFAVIIALWLAILLTIITFHKTSRAAAWLLVPYLLWVSFATYLNGAIWMSN